VQFSLKGKIIYRSHFGFFAQYIFSPMSIGIGWHVEKPLLWLLIGSWLTPAVNWL
jgi:hypothetical protein